MNIPELAGKLGAEILIPGAEDADVKTAYTSDLLSDVLGNAEDDAILITIQAHRNTVAVAFQVNAHAVLVCNGREVPPDMLEAARKEDIAVLRTKENQFLSSHRVHVALFGG
jgi:predicted transcriptional regulator